MTLSQSEMTALAILRCGRSFKEASDVTQIPINFLMSLWNNFKQK